MSKTVDERVVSMRFDNAQFERGAKQTMDTLNQLEKSLSLDGAKRGLQEAGKAINSFSLEGIASQIDSLRAKFDWKSIIGVTALMNIANDVVNTFKNMVNQISIAPIKQGFEEYELKMGAVQTMIASTGESLETVNGYLEQLNLYADKTIYSFSDMTQNIGKFTNNGVKLEDAVKAIQGISNAAAVAGANSNEASRAMYNFSQALSQGSVKLIDWKSIQNANMATVDFKQNLIDTAVAMGTLKKKGDQYVSTTTDLSGKVSDAFDANKMFNESLSHSWMTTEVLVQTLSNYSTDVREMSETELEAYRTKLKSIGYTEEQIKAIEALSTKAFKAATEVKTYHQLMDTLAEAVGSGWSQTFEIIFGDFEESKKLWTGINDVIGSFINETSNARNNMLLAWDAFGGRTELIDALTDAFNNFVTIVKAIKDAFREIFPKNLSVTTKGVAGAFKEVSGGAKILVDATHDLAKAVKDLTPSEETLDKISRTFKGIFAVLDVGKKIVVSVFKAIKPNAGSVLEIGSNLLDITARIGDALTNFDQNFDPEKSFGKVLSGVKIVIEELQNFITDITDFKFQIEEWGTSVGGIFAIIFNDLIYLPIETAVRLIGKLLGKSNDELAEWHEKFLRPLSNIRGAIVDFLDNFKPFDNLNFKMPDLTAFKEFADTIIDRVNPLQTAWNIIKSVGTGIVKIFSTIGTVLGPIGKSLGGAIENFFNMIADYFKNATFDEFLDLVNSGILTVLGVQLAGLVGNLKSLSGVGKNAGEAVKGPIESLLEFAKNPKESLGKLGDGLKELFGVVNDEGDNAGILKTLSESILMLAGALFVLALIPSDKLTVSMIAITALFADLMKSMEFMEKSLGGGKKTLSVAASLTLVTGAMLEMALAMQVMSAMSWERVAKGLTNFAASMAVITGSFKALKDDDLTKTAASIWIVSNAMIQMGIGMQAMSAMSWSRVGKGITVFASSMGVMALTFKILKGDEIIKTAGAIWIFSNAMIQLGAAIQIMGAMSWDRLARSLAALGGSIGMMVLAFNLIKGEDLIKTAGAIWIFAQAMTGMAIAMQVMGAMNGSAVAKSLIAFGGAMIIMVKAFNDIDNKQILLTAAAMWVFAQAMIGMSAALQIMGALSVGGLVKSLLAFGGTIGILIVALNNINALDAVKIAGSLLLISVAMTALGTAMLLLGSIGIDKVLISLGALAGILTILGVASALLGPFSGYIMLLGASLAAAGAGMLMFGAGMAAMAAALMLVSSIGTVAISNILASLELLVVGGLKILQHSAAALAELVVSLLDDILVLIRGIVPNLVETFLLLVDEVLASLATHGPEILRNVITIISSLFDQLNAYLPTFITQVADFIIAIIDGIATNLPRIMVAVMNLLGALLQGAIDALNSLDRDTLVNGLLAVGLMASLMAALAGMALLAAPAAAGVLAFGGVITELGLILAAIGALAQIPGLDWLINEGGDLLNSIGGAIGKFIGGIGEGLSESLPEIGANLSAFMDNAGAFISIAKTIDRSVYDGIQNLIDAMSLALGGSFLTRIKGFITGDNDFSKFGTKLREFGQALKSFANETSGIDSDQVSECAKATLELVKMAQQIPNEGGLVSLITGDNSLGKFAEELAEFGPSLKKFADSVQDIDVAQVEGAAKATLLLTEMATNIPNSGGLVSLITGDNSLGDFGYELNTYGVYLRSFSANLKGLRIKAINEAADATGKLIAMAKQVPNSGGLVSLITGDNSLAEFGRELGAYGKNLAKFGSSVKGLMSEDFTGAIDATERLITMASGIPNTGGIVSWVTGDNSLADFGAELAKFGPKLAKFSESIKGINTSKIKVAADAVKVLTEIKIPTNGGILSALTGKQSLSKYGKELKSFGLNLALFDDNTSGIDYENIKKAIKATEDIIAIDIPKTGGILSWFTGDVKLSKIGKQFANFAPSLNTFATETSGISLADVQIGAAAAAALLEIEYPKSGGVFSWFTGDIKLGKFGTEIGAFATGLVTFANSVKSATFDEEKIEAAAKCSNALIGIAKDVPPTDGIKTWISGKDKLAKFAESITKFAKTMFTGGDNILDAISNITDDNVTQAEKVGKIFGALVTGLSDVKPATVGKLGTSMKNLGKGLKDFSESVSDKDFDIQRVSAAISQLAEVAKHANDLKTLGDVDFSNLIYLFGQLSSDVLVELRNAFSTCSDVAVTSLKDITDALNSFVYDFGLDKGTIQTHCTNITSAVELMQNKVSSAFGVMASDLATLISKFKIAFNKDDFIEFGNNVTLGIAEGLDTGDEEVKESANKLAQLIIDTIETRLEIKSPSKVGTRIGKYFDAGVANGMEEGITSIEDSTYSAADAAMNAMKEAFKSINTLAEDELNTEPVIKPVLDMSNIEGSNRLGTIFTAGIGLSSGFKNAQGIIRSKDINSAANNASTIDPKQMNDLLAETKLMREEIGNFSNELSNMKVVMDSGALVGQIGPGMDIYLGQRSVQMGRSI